VPQHVTRLVAQLVVDYFADAACPGASARRAARRVAPRRLLRLAQLVVDYFAYAARPGASARRAARCRLLRPCCASECLSTSHGSSCGSSSTTSPTPHVRVPRHVARLLVDYFASRSLSSTTSPTPRVRVPRHVARLVVDYFAYAMRPAASARRRLLRPRRASGCLGTSCGSLSPSSPTPRVRVPQHVARLVARLLVDYYASRILSSTTSPMSRVWVPRHVARLVVRLVVDYFTHATRPGVSAHRAACCRLLRRRRASRCLGTSRGSSSDSSSTASPMPRVRVPRHIAWPVRGSSSTTSTTSRVRVPRHVTRLVARLVVDYFADTAHPGASARRAAPRRLLRHAQLVVDYFAYAACLSASARCAARRRLLHLHCARLPWLAVDYFASRGSSSTTSVVDYFAYAVRSGASARRVARRRLLRLAQARRRLLFLGRVSGCLGTSCGSSSITSLMLCVRLPRLVVDYFAHAAHLGASARRAARRRLLCLRRASGCLGTSRGSSSTMRRRAARLLVGRSHWLSTCARSLLLAARLLRAATRLVVRSHWLYFSHAVHHDYLSRGNTGSTSSMPRAAATSSSGRIVSTTHLD
jgi:hypothetical protein